MKKIFYKIFKKRNVIDEFINIFKVFFSALIGFVLSLLLNNIYAFFIAFALLILSAIILSLLFSKRKNMFDILKLLKEEQMQRKWIEIIRLGYPLSRPLWLSARYNLRIEIGEYIKEAASSLPEQNIKIGNETLPVSKIYVSVLIDDLGWTNYVIEQTDVAISNIKAGILMAEEKNYIDLEIKGYRHLCGIYSKKNDDDFLAAREKLDDLISKLPPDTKKPMQAGIIFSRAEDCLNKKEYDDAIKYALEARNLFYDLDDRERVVKTYHTLASCYKEKEKGNYSKAETEILEGIELSQQYSRTESLIKNTILLLDIEYNIISNISYFTYDQDEVISRRIENPYRDALNACAAANNVSLEKKLRLSYKNINRLRKNKLKRGTKK